MMLFFLDEFHIIFFEFQCLEEISADTLDNCVDTFYLRVQS